MLDLSFIPNSQQDIKIYQSAGGSWQTWQKPRKCNYVWIMCIGGAGGGGGGFGLYTSFGGQGGGGAAISRVLYNSQHIPDTLYVQVGLGGAGGVGATTTGGSGTNGSPGTKSFVSMAPNSTVQNLVATSGNAAASGGVGDGTGSVTIQETAMVQTNATFIILSNFVGTTGQPCPANASPYTDITPLTSTLVSAGACGGSSNYFIGGSILSTSISPQISGGTGTVSPSQNGGNGQNGYTSWKPFYSLGGAGGASTTNVSTANGGDGGNGGIGSGGGGGGSASVTTGINRAGNGGKGGDGLVIIISF